MKTAYRASGKPITFLELVRRLSTIAPDGKVEFRGPEYRIVDKRVWTAAVDTLNHAYRDDAEAERYVTLLVYNTETTQWDEVGTLGTEPYDPDDATPDTPAPRSEVAYDIYLSNDLTLAMANSIVRWLDWDWTP